MPTVSPLRVAATALVLALAASACSDGLDDVIDELPVFPPATGSDGTAPPGSGSDGPAGGTPDGGTDATAPTGGGDGGGDDGGTTSAPGGGLTPADDTASVGANARALLRGDRPTLVLEIDTQQGVEVDQRAVDHLVAVLGEVVDKPGGIVREGDNEFADDRTSWTADDLRAVAAQNRSTATTDDRVSVHLLYVAGSHAQGGSQTNAIGVAYSASTAALFPQRWEGVTSLLGSNTAIERAVLVHELGHLLALVNLGYTSDLDHEDPDRPGHSSNQRSVMFHAIESTLIGQVFSGPPPDRFDDADRSDLEGLRTGRL